MISLLMYFLFIQDLKIEVNQLDQENQYITREVENSNYNYNDINEKLVENTKFYKEKLFEISAKLLNENNSKELHLVEKENMNKVLTRFSGENVHYNRTLEKNKLFKEDKDEKNKVVRNKTIENFNEVEKSVVRNVLDYQSVFQKYESYSKKIELDTENSQLIQNINKLLSLIQIRKGPRYE
jgi:hypothetical protein